LKDKIVFPAKRAPIIHSTIACISDRFNFKFGLDRSALCRSMIDSPKAVDEKKIMAFGEAYKKDNHL
jgi:hypothetical protein